MKFFRIKYFYSLICVLFAFSAIVCANESFQNNLLKADLSQTSPGTVVLNLYMSKPYSEPITVNKKSDTEYVILLPETSNSMTSKPALKQNVNSVKNVDVKTQQYSDKIKGYTKIAISSIKPIVILPQMHTLNSSDYISDRDYRELLSQMVEKELIKQAKTKQKNIVKPQIKQAGKTETVLSQNPIKTKQKLPTDKIKPAKNEIAKETLKEQTEIAQEKETQIATATQPEVQQLPKDILKINPEPQKTLKTNLLEKSLTTIKNIIKNENFVIFGSILAGLLFLLLLIKRVTRKHPQPTMQNEQLNESFEQPNVDISNYTQDFTEDMSWKEKFQTYVDATQTNKNNPSVDEILQEETLSNEDFPIINEAPINQPETQETIIEETSQPYTETSSEKTFRELVYSNPEPIKNDINIDMLFGGDEENYDNEEEFFDDVFEEDIININKHVTQEQSIEETSQDELVKSEFNIDSNKGFYLVDFEDKTALVGHIDDEIFVLKRFDNKIDGILQARINEKKGSGSNYMTKVGNFRGLIEVTPDTMNLLIEL